MAIIYSVHYITGAGAGSGADEAARQAARKAAVLTAYRLAHTAHDGGTANPDDTTLTPTIAGADAITADGWYVIKIDTSKDGTSGNEDTAATAEVLGGSVLSVAFASPIAWDAFNTMWLGGAAGTEDDAPFNTDDLLFNGNDAGKAALTRILRPRGPGADIPVEPLRSVAIGDGEANVIDLSGESGGWVIDGGGGDDMITLGADTPPADAAAPTGGNPPYGAREVVYRLAIDEDNSDAITTPDGSDRVSGFTFGEDMLTFVDTMGEAPQPTLPPRVKP